MKNKAQKVLWTFAAVLIGSVWAFAAYRMHSDYESTLENARNETGSFARAFEEHVVRTLQLADQAALFIKYEYEHDGPGFRLNDWVKESQKTGTIFNLYSVTDEKSDVVMSSQAFTPVNLADREHIKVHFERDTGQLFISKPVLGRVSKKWSIQLTRRINKPDGSFGGVVVVSLDPFYFSHFYREVNLGRNGSAALVGADGIVRARQSGDVSTVGQDISGSESFRAISGQPVGTYAASSAVDGVARMYTFRKLTDYPAYVVVGLATDEVLAGYYESRRDTLVITALFSVMALGFTALLVSIIGRLEASRVAAVASGRAKMTFVANMSHELRTPLNGILGFADLLKEDLAGTPQAEFAEAIHDSGTHLLALVNDILDIGKLEAGKAELELEQVPLAELLGQVVGLHTAPAQKKGLRVALDISSGVPPVVELDRTKVTRVLNNLLHNAVKFTQRGKVDVLVGRSGDEVIFAVRDTGPGIPGGKQATLFERFSQGDSSETRAHEGTGLGLALSRDLVTLMGGRIWFKSQFGHGSTFWFSLPIRAPKSAGAAAAAAAPAAVDA